MKNNKKTNVYKFEKNNKSSKVKKICSINERIARNRYTYSVVLLILIFRLAWLQIVQGAELKERNA